MNSHNFKNIIAIDGPAGSGKSTIARVLAQRLGLEYLDTGAMYRAVAFVVLQKSVSIHDQIKVLEIAQQIDLKLEDDLCLINNRDTTKEIRGAEVTKAVSVVAAMPNVRKEMVDRQRAWVDQRGGGVIEGRDIGSVVFPYAKVKVFLTATEAIRAKRRSEQEDSRNSVRVAADIRLRDRADTGRADSPLVLSDGAIELDTSALTIHETVEKILGLFNVD